jgi:Dipeptidyl aminopeptidases/acylaminoacyl-peptidases
LRIEGDDIFLRGQGASSEGDRPFFDRLNLKTFETQRLFRCDKEHLETALDWVDPAAGTFLTRRESPTEYPNYQLRTLERKPLDNAVAGEARHTSSLKAVTSFPDPFPMLKGHTKQRITAHRPDGVAVNFTLYLPPNHTPGVKLPTVFWAYPLDYTEASNAGQVQGSTKEFTFVGGTSNLFFLLQGYAVMEVSMPVVGPVETAYDTFIEQLEANAKAAIDKADELGVIDRDRIGVGGHSHGALMTTTFITHSNLFRAGIARSGAYNHTLRPFGFQNEKRTLYEAKDTYVKLSPLIQADKIKKPLLLIHGEIDSNPGTVPLQSEKLFEALRGLGAPARLVMLPYEDHGYRARESTEHVLYEMISWFDTHVKNAPPRQVAAAQ